MPAELRATIGAEKPMFFAEGIRVTLRRSGSVPGRILYASVRSLSGAFAATGTRVVASVGAMVILNAPWHFSESGSMTALFDSSGLHLHIDLSLAHAGTGTIGMHFKYSLQPVLHKLPMHRLGLSPTPDRVRSLFRSVY